MQVKELRALLDHALPEATVFLVKYVEGQNEPELKSCTALIHNNTQRVEIHELTQAPAKSKYEKAR